MMKYVLCLMLLQSLLLYMKSDLQSSENNGVLWVLSKCCPCFSKQRPNDLKDSAELKITEGLANNTNENCLNDKLQSAFLEGEDLEGHSSHQIGHEIIQKQLKKDKLFHKAPTQNQMTRSAVESVPKQEEEMQQYMNRTGKGKASNYPIYKYGDHQLLVVGDSKGKLLCKIGTACVKPSQEAEVNTRRSRKEKSTYKNYLDKYWYKRYYLFEKFDEGINLDEESWYSVTPQAVAEYMASSLTHLESLLDGFCGAGGDSIQFARVCLEVISNDIDPIKINCLVRNCQVYGVSNVRHSCCDFFELKNVQVSAVYLAPPWGGPDYHEASSLSPEEFSPSLSKIIVKALEICQNLVFLLPANTNIDQLASVLSRAYRQKGIMLPSCSMRVERIYFLDRFKFIGVWIGPAVQTLIKLSDELQFIYGMLNEDPEKPFRHKRVIRTLREEHGMINLLNYVFESEKLGTLQSQSLMDNLYQLISQKQLISTERMLQILEQQQIENQKQSTKLSASKKRAKNRKAFSKKVEDYSQLDAEVNSQIDKSNNEVNEANNEIDRSNNKANNRNSNEMGLTQSYLSEVNGEDINFRLTYTQKQSLGFRMTESLDKPKAASNQERLSLDILEVGTELENGGDFSVSNA